MGASDKKIRDGAPTLPSEVEWVQATDSAIAPSPHTVRVSGREGFLTRLTFSALRARSATLPTHPSSGLFSLRKRLDYLWADRGGGAKQSCAFLEPVRRSMHFGSDHRFVWGDVYLP